jgi:hypothetical protein
MLRLDTKTCQAQSPEAWLAGAGRRSFVSCIDLDRVWFPSETERYHKLEDVLKICAPGRSASASNSFSSVERRSFSTVVMKQLGAQLFLQLF